MDVASEEGLEMQECISLSYCQAESLLPWFSLAFKNITILPNSLHVSDNKYGLKTFTALSIWWSWELALTEMKLYPIKMLNKCHRDKKKKKNHVA